MAAASKSTAVCSVLDCERPVRAKGLCQAHHMRLHRYGDPAINNRKIGRSVCEVMGCDRFVVGHGKCSRHYIRPEPARRCEVSGCERPHKGHGLCRVHLMRKRKHGDVDAARPIRERTASAWLLEHVKYVGDECLIWPFTRTRQGYGNVTRTVVGGKRGNMGAARAMCILAHGEPPSAEHVAAHSCGQGHEGCVNPSHLRWATVAENIADTLQHGTRRTLGLAGRRSLTELQVRAVRLLAPHMTDQELAVTFGVPLDAIERLTRAVRPDRYR